MMNAIYVLVKCLFKCFALLSIRESVFLLLICENYLYTLDICLLPDSVLQKFFPPIYGLIFHFLNNAFQRIEVLNFTEAQFILFFFLRFLLCVLSKKSLPNPGHQDFPLEMLQF